MSGDRAVHSSFRVPGPRRVLPPFQRLVRGQLRLRVLIAVVSVTLAALAAFDFTAVTMFRGYLLSRTDTSLRAAATALATGPALTGPDAANKLKAWISAHQFLVGQYSLFYTSRTGPPTALEDGSPPLPGNPSSNVPSANLPDLIVNGQPQTLMSAFGQPLRAVAIHKSGRALVVSISLDDLNQAVGRMRLILLIGSAAVVLLIGLGVSWLLWRGLRPIETMAEQADRITAGDLTDRVTPQDARSEVGRLGAALNGMLGRIEASVHEREAGQELMRQFFADASHELRTPLASLRANAELYQQGALPERAQVDEVMRRIALEARRMSGLVDDMLRLARLDQHPDRQREPVELTGLVAGCVDRIRVAAPRHVWGAEISDGVVVTGDEELLRRAVDNLLANVLAHTPEGTSATVTLREHDGAAEIEVSDTGPGVPPDRLPRIFDRFYRADTTSRPGSGLGLAIAAQIAAVHEGTLVAEPNPPHGLRARLTLPVAGPGDFTRVSHDSEAEV